MVDFDVMIDISDLERKVETFKSFPEEAQALIDNFLIEAGWFFHREATLREGEGGHMPYDTGTLQASITVDPVVYRDGITRYVLVGTNVHYAIYQEYGWRSRSGRDIGGKHFMGYAANQTYEFMRRELPFRLRRLEREMARRLR